LKPPDRWPVHPAPIAGEALSSWLRRIAASYQMNVAELLEHGLGHDDPQVERDLDADPPARLLAALGQRTNIAPSRLREMTLAGWTPWLLDSLQPDRSAFDTYARQFSILLKAGKRSKHIAGPWRAWISLEPLKRACPCCVEEADRAGLLLIGLLPLSLSCPEHRVMLEPVIGFPGDWIVWIDDGDPPRAASKAVQEMDDRTQQGLRTGQVQLPGRSVHAGVWFRLLRTLLDEVSTPATYWRPHADDLRRVWASCGHPVRAGQPTWRPFEVWPWPVQTQLLQAAAESIQLLENRTITGHGTHASLFAPAPHPPVDDGRSQAAREVDEYTQRWDRFRTVLEEAVQAARGDPAKAQAFYDLLVIGCRSPQAIAKLLANLDELGIRTDHLSHKEASRPVRVT
jgi:hypothetical protein